jgi:endonuclease/exonuclease/phosphatase family metal-dependent hydrolase
VTVGSVATWAPVLGTAGWAGARAFGLERGMLPVQLMAFTPYVTAVSVIPLAVALGRRRWVAAGIAAAAATTLVASVVPRIIPDDPAATAGPMLRVMSSNMFIGGADAATMVRLVREYRVDVLAVQELTDKGERSLKAAGLEELLPNRMTNAEPGAAGTGVFTRFTITTGAARKLSGSGFVQTAVTLNVPGAPPVTLESAHPCAPVPPGRDGVWQADVADQPGATPDGTLRVLMGDFNATLDHSALRRLISTGYRDAASVVGAGLTPTWPNDGRLVPGVTLDHVLADRRIGVHAYSVHGVPRTDHRSVIADLILPAA